MLTYFNVFSLSFVIIAQNKFKTTPAKKGFALICLRHILWEKVHIPGKLDDQGFIKSEGLRVRYENITVRIFYLTTPD
jgi:hypothetical protein